MRAREVHGRPVVTLDTADDVAEVKDVVFDYDRALVVGLTLNKRGRLSSPLASVLPWSRVAALGRDAVMIADESALVEADETMRAAGNGRGDVIGATVMTESGKELGTVVDLVVSVDSQARVIGFEIDGPGVERDRSSATLLIPAADTIAVSGQALILPEAAEEFVGNDLAGFASAVAEFRRRLSEAERPAGGAGGG